MATISACFPHCAFRSGKGFPDGWLTIANLSLTAIPRFEPGYLNDPTKFSTLRSALAIPLEGVNGVIGVLALYRGERDAFTSDHLRILLAISSKMALAI